jgi:hypothetical protein
MCPDLSCVLPKRFGGVELWRIWRQIEYLDPFSVILEPFPHRPIFMVGGIVLDKKDSTTMIMLGDLFKKSDIGLRIENVISSVIEFC